MKRPMLLVGFTYLAALVAATYFSIEITKYAIITSLILFICSLLIKSIRSKKILPIAFLTAAIAFIMYSVFTYVKVKPIEQLDGKDVVVSGRICELPYQAYNRYYYVIETDRVDFEGANQNIKLRVSMSKALDADLYDRITGKVHMFLPTDDGGFSSKSYYASKGMHMLSYLYEYEDYKVEPQQNKPIYYYFLKSRYNLIESIRTLLPKKQASVAVGVLLGDKYLLDEDVKSNFRDVGISHILAVSGLHTSVVAAVVFALLKATKLPRRYVIFLTCISIVCFMALTGFSASVMRAGIMLIVFYIGELFYTKADSLNSLGIATLLLTVFNPFSAGDMGLLLSVTATLGIILFEGYFEEIIKHLSDKLKYGSKIINKIAGVISVTISATIATMPIVVLSFGKISLISIVSNILVVLPAMIMMIFVFMAAILYLITPLKFMAFPIALLSGMLINYITWCVDILAKIPFASISTRQPMILFWLGATCVLVAVALILCEKYKFLKLSGILSIIILFVGTLSYQILDRGVTHLALLDTGNGCSAVISRDGHASVLSCGGDDIKSSKIQYYLDSQNVSNIDYLLLGDFDDKTSNYAKNVVEEFEPYYIVMPNEESIDDKLSRSIADSSKSVYFKDMADISFWDNIKVTPLKFNGQSYISLIVNDVKFLINPSGGNASVLPNKYRNCDVLVTSGTLKNQELISSAYSVTTADLDVSSKIVDDIAKSGKVPIATAGDGDIVFDFKGRKNISIRRVI